MRVTSMDGSDTTVNPGLWTVRHRVLNLTADSLAAIRIHLVNGLLEECLNDGDGTPVILRGWYTIIRRLAACPDRLFGLDSAGMLHITRAQAATARWCRETMTVNITRTNLKNWRMRGLLHPRHVEGAL